MLAVASDVARETMAVSISLPVSFGKRREGGREEGEKKTLGGKSRLLSNSVVQNNATFIFGGNPVKFVDCLTVGVQV